MAYRYEKDLNGKQDLVIDGFEKGIASSPFKGIGNIRNLNVKYYEGVAYVNYKRQPCTISGGTMGNPLYACKSPAGLIYISDSTRHIWKQSAVDSSTFNLLTGNFNQTIGGIAFWNNYLFVIGDDVNGRFEVCGDGTGDSGVTSSNWNTSSATTGVWPIRNSTSMTLTGVAASGDTSATISSYTDGQGVSRSFWNGPTGVYNVSFLLSDGTTQVVTANFTQGSADFTWTPGLNNSANSTSVSVFYNGSTATSTGVQHMSLIAANTGDLYYCNGSNIGAITLNPNQILSKGNMKTFTFYSNILSLPPTETSTWLTELQANLIVMGQYKLYPWDFTSIFWTNPVPMDETIIKGINILNNIYIFAGNKGNVYISNGYSVSRLFKLPDYIAGVIDPSWSIGGIMQHRQKLFFQALAKNGQTGTAILAGIFSYDLDTKALIMDNQNSEGLTPAGIAQSGILVDDNSISINYDKYYSAYSATTNSIDFNDTTLYSSNEAVIETDIVPVGTFLQNKTFASAEFKLDQPLQSGDSISLYIRPSLSDSYTLLGTTTTATLSFAYQPMVVQNMQWAQFKITQSCNAASTSSSFNRLREVRIR